jgi:hypothetical protein
LEYSSNRVYTLARSMFEKFANIPITSATPQALTAWGDYLRSTGKKSSTVRTYLYAVKNQCVNLTNFTVPTEKLDITDKISLAELRSLFNCVPLTPTGLHDFAILLGIISGDLLTNRNKFVQW